MNGQKIHIVFNPASAGGKTGEKKEKIVEEFRNQLGDGFKLSETSKISEATDITKRAVCNGCGIIIAVGGDGTIHEVVNGLFHNGKKVNSNCKLGIINSGTGEGFAQSLCLPKTIEEQVRTICKGHTKAIDVGRIIFSAGGSLVKTKYFINEFQAGIGGTVVKNASTTNKKKGALFAYGIGVLKNALSYKAKPYRLIINGYKTATDELLGIVIGNGNLTAGGMKLTPSAKMNDGLFDLLLIHSQSRLERLKNFPKIYTGKHIYSNKFSYHQLQTIEIDSDYDIPLEADGEVFGSLPCRIEILPSALEVFSKIEKDY